ncbi:hypothetical protein AB205_0209410 [Aquarana catesbeiana]|uniref:Uncharacterized protein n=1 Tax=Aquarana catesbeiana TaxID=8400 RepID=A0A2G9RA70_AQUCT|nr:hypothetical protein AB205_0209410 [Aquarana catesbeiana]
MPLRPPLTFFLVYFQPLVFWCSGRAHGGERASACRQQQRRKPKAMNIPIPEEIKGLKYVLYRDGVDGGHLEEGRL